MSPAPHPPKIEVECVATRDAFLALEGEWTALADTASSPLLRYDWFAACLEAYAADHELAIYLGRRDGRLRAVAPLVVERAGGVRHLRLLGWQTMEPEAFLYDDEEALEQVCAAALVSHKPVFIRRLDTQSAELRLLQTLARGRGVSVVRAASTQSHATVLQSDWAAMEASMASKKRSELRRLKTQLEKHGPVTFEVRELNEAGLDEAFAELLRVEAASWKSRAETAMASDIELQTFIRTYARAAARAGILRLSFLRVGGQAIAVQMDMEHGGRLWGLKMGVDEAWSKYAPGILSTHELIRWAIGRGLERCEHLGTAETWQRRWPFELREQSTFRFYPPRPAGALALGRDSLDFARRYLRKRARRQPSKRASQATLKAETSPQA